MRYLIFILPLLACTQERVSNPLSNYLDGEYPAYRVVRDVPVDTLISEVLINEVPTLDTSYIYEEEEDFYFNSATLLEFTSSFGQSSGNIFDFNSNGVVDATDLADAMSGYGSVFEPNYDIESAQVLGQFSSGWILDLDGWEVCFLKVTPSDEGGEFIPETLNSFFLEGERNGQTYKVWYHAY